MFTVNDIENEIVINKSRFITNMFFIEDVDDINNYLDLVKNKYKDATHHCFAYIIGNVKRFSDDGEPGGTAGIPILECLEKNKLNHVLCIVTRYFGGIKLGAGGLVRAYTSSVTSALTNTLKRELKEGYLVIIKFDYNRSREMDKLLSKYKIVNKSFDDIITYEVEIDENGINKLNELNTPFEIKKNQLLVI